MTALFLVISAFLFFFFWRCARRYFQPFVSTYFGLALCFLWMAIFGALYHFWR